MKKSNYFILVFLVLIFSENIVGQTAEMRIPEVWVNDTTTIVKVPIIVSNMPDISAISLWIDYEDSVLSYIEIDTTFNDISFIVNVDSLLKLAWYNINPIRPGNDTLAILTFGYDSDATPMNFLADRCDIADSTGNSLNVNYINGFVGHITLLSNQSVLKSPGFQLHQNYPNPFNPETEIRYQISNIKYLNQNSGYVDLAVYDIVGRKVRTLVNKIQPPGSYSVSWDGRDDAGLPLASGVYFYELRSGDFSQTRKMMLVR